MRRLPQSFVQPWDQWLQETLAGARDRLGEQWADTYFTAPIWRFALAPAVCGEHGWAGVLMSSVDKVGRMFPLTLATRLPGPAHLATALFDCAAWFARLEEVALAALRVDADIQSLDLALTDTAFPNGERGWPYAAMQSLAQPREVPLQLNDASDFARVLTIAATEAFATTPGWHTYWWSGGRSDGHAAALTLSGLPDARTFATMLSI